ncbi:MAG: N-6 DNA methylase [Anaerostipes sp.]|nr:N-6 DNA methylase [Anaerostipes sp.]
MNVLISNPPYNLKWEEPPFAVMQPRFNDCGIIPPKSNANYTFILTALDMAERSVILLPNGVLSTENKQEKAIKRYLLKKNYIEAVIMLPDAMFEKTSISTCILVLKKHRETMDISFIDMRNTYTVEERKQNGQFGGVAHEKRIYTKKIKVLSDKHIEEAINATKGKISKAGFSANVPVQQVLENECNLMPSRYIEIEQEEYIHRDYKDILKDLNHTIKEKNLLKLTINETIAKSLGLYEFGQIQKESRLNTEQMSANMESMFGIKIEKDNYISLSKNKGEIKFENMSKEVISPIFSMIFQAYKQHIFYLNQEESRYLVELRDAMLPDLMSGKLEIELDKPF